MNPFSFEAIKAGVMKFNASVPRLRIVKAASPQEEQSGGIRAFPQQGTMSQANTPDPLDPSRSVNGSRHNNGGAGWDDIIETPPYAIFDSQDTPAIDGTEGTIIQVRDWPPNPSRDVIEPPSGHTEQLRTDFDLQSGPPPGRIARLMPMRIYGVANGMISGQRGDEGYPWNGDEGFMAHLPIARQAQITKGPQKLADDNVPIPSVYAGNPR